MHLSGEARRSLSVYTRRKWLLLAVVVLIPAATYGISKQIQETYEASTTLIVRATNIGPSVFSNNLQIAVTGAEDAVRLAQTLPVAKAAAEQLGEPPVAADRLLSRVTASFEVSETGGSSDFMNITAQANSAERAADLANAFATALTSTRTEDARAEIEKTIGLIQEQAANIDPKDDAGAAELAAQLQQLEGLQASQENATAIIEPAVAPSAPVSPQPGRNAALAFVFALLVAAGLAPALQSLDRRIRDEEDLADVLGVPTLAVIPVSGFPGKPPTAAARESFQTLRAALTYYNIDRSLKVILVCSPAQEEGKTTVATNLAAAISQDETNVILIDGDLRKPQVANRLGAREDSLGLEQVLVDNHDVHEALQEIEVPGSGSLRIIASHMHAPNPAVLLGSKRMHEFVAELSDEADLVIIDTPPLLAVSDAIPLMRDSSGVVLVARLGSTSRDNLLRAKEMIGAAHGTLLGSVLTGAKASGLDSYGGYGYASYEEVSDNGTEAVRTSTVISDHSVS